MDIESTFHGWSSMHQPVDWDYAGFMPDMFAPLAADNPVQQPTPVTTIAPAPLTYFPCTWASSMHQPVDWETPALMSQPALAAAQPSSQPMQDATVAQPYPAASAQAPASAPLQAMSSVLTATTSAAAAQPQQPKEPGSNSNKRDRGVRRAKSNTLRPQQQQMMELQKKLDALLHEHTVVEAENERLKTRLRVLEAVLPVRQQQARWAQSKAATEGRNLPPADPVLVNLLDLAASGPSSCATSPSRAEAGGAAACGGCGCGTAGDGCGANGRGAADEAAPPVDMAAGSPVPAAASGEPAPCASSSCGTVTTTTTTSGTSANPPARSTGALACAGQCHRRSCSHHVRGDGARHNHSHEHHPHSHGHGRGNTHGCSGGRHGTGKGVHRGYCNAPHHAESQARWLDAWRSWVREAALLLQAHDARPNEHYLNRLEEAFTKLKSEVVYLGLRHPELICNMRCVNLETGAEQEFPPDSFWSLVVAGMKLNSQQVANCKSALALYRERMAVVLTERRSLAAQMSTCLTSLQLEEAEGRAVPGSIRREQLTLEAEEAASALDANVAIEGHTTSLARDLLGSNLFSRLQCARASVLSYPYFPDALAIITAAVGEHDNAPSPPPPPPPPGLLSAQQQTRSGDNAAQVQAQP